MTSKERLDAFYAGKETDRRVNLTIVGSVVTQYTGIDIETYCRDWKAMTDAAILCAKDLQLDFVQIASDLVREAEGYGSEIAFFPDKLPTVKKYALEDITDVADWTAKRVEDIPRLYDLVKATEYAAKTCTDIHPMTLAVGPATVAANIRGVENLLMDSYDEPEAVAQLMALCEKTTESFIEALAKVGGKYLYVADPVASLFSPALYEEMILPLHTKLFSFAKQQGMGTRLHMCGDTTGILPHSSKCGAEIIDIDYAVSYPEALEAVEGRCVLNGNIDPVSDVFSCTAEHTYEAILALGKAITDKRALFMPGCELPTKTPLENARAIAKALADLG